MGYRLAKRVFDVVFAILVGIFFLPLILLISLAIRLDSAGPIFYRAKRVGQKGKIFDMFKFRSMLLEADEFLLQNPKYMRKFKSSLGWKFGEAEEDPRITRVGRFIRRFSLDELPQLGNILRGEMSMVGPRAYRKDDVGDEIEEQLKLFPKLREEVQQALSVKPGITGPWQVSGRNKLSWEERVELDAAYAIRRSIIEDLVIILKTPFAMINKW